MHDTKRPALSRSWKATITYRECGVVTGSSTHTVTLSRELVGGPLSATVDSQAASVRRAVNLLEGAQVEVLAEVLSLPTIGNPAACELHRELGRLKYRDHYAAASEALGLTVRSLASLTAAQAQAVREYAYGQWGLTA